MSDIGDLGMVLCMRWPVLLGVAILLGCDGGAPKVVEAGHAPAPAPAPVPASTATEPEPESATATSGPETPASDPAVAPSPDALLIAPSEVDEGPAVDQPTELPGAHRDGWACLCMRERVPGSERKVTACRRRMSECVALHERARKGTRTLVRGSVEGGFGCRFLGEAEHPGDRLGGREGWVASAKVGAWARPGRCLLAMNPYTTMRLESSLGPLTLGMSAAQVTKLLGAPARKGAVEFEAATGDHTQRWHYPAKGLELGMAAPSERGAQKLSYINAKAPCELRTPNGVWIGADYDAAVSRHAHHAAPEDEQPGDESFIAGSIYGGVFFSRDSEGKVNEIFIGAGAE